MLERDGDDVDQTLAAALDRQLHRYYPREPLRPFPGLRHPPRVRGHRLAVGLPLTLLLVAGLVAIPTLLIGRDQTGPTATLTSPTPAGAETATTFSMSFTGSDAYLAAKNAIDRCLGLPGVVPVTEAQSLPPGYSIRVEGASNARTALGCLRAIPAATLSGLLEVTRRPVPDVVGLTGTEAQNRLTAAGFSSAVRTGQSADSTSGTVIAQDPAAGDLRFPGENVFVTVS